jgi:hypothetical protein
MDIICTFAIDINNSLELSFLHWFTKHQNDDKSKLKEAMLTGYFIIENGINDYYKNRFENELKDVSEKDMLCKIEKIEDEKKELNDDIETLKHDYNRKINNLTRLNEDLQVRLEAISCQIETEALKIKDQTARYYEERSQKEIELMRLESTTTCKELEYQISRLTHELNDVKTTDKMVLDVATNNIQEKYQIEISLLKEQTDNANKQIEYFRKLTEEKDILLRDAFKNETKEKIASLESLISQKDTELATLKTCNFVKGMTGESIIASFLREYYPRNIIHNTGKTAHEGDIQMIDTKDDTLIVIESKYKQAIDKNDVEKFCRDVSTVSQKEGSTQCIGGLFVSLLTRNIPGKGDAYFELIGNIPVMYVGFSNTDEFNIFFKKYVDMFNELCKFHQQQGRQKSNIDDMLEEMNFFFNMLVKNKTRLEDFKANCVVKLNKFVSDIEGDNKLIISRLEDILKKNNSLKYKNMHCCDKCDEVFSNKRLLNKHMKTCGT